MTQPTTNQDVRLRAVVYLRANSAAMLAAQRDTGKLRADELGAAIVSEFADINLGEQVTRKHLRWMLADITTSGDIDYVIIPTRAALAKNSDLYQRIAQRIERAEVELVVADTPPGQELETERNETSGNVEPPRDRSAHDQHPR